MNIDKYQPDYSISPGEILAEILDSRGISQIEFAHKCGKSPKMIEDIIHGQVSIDSATAMQFEYVLDIPAQTWINLDSNYRKALPQEDQLKKSHDKS